MKGILVIAIIIFTSKYAAAQIYGCTDPLATNYNSSATHNDGSCMYGASSVSPVSSWNLPKIMHETSGLIIWKDKIWTHNDSEDINIYAFDTVDVNNFQTYPLTGTINTDWEEVSQDSSYIYIGDFGNNANGNRTDLKILRIEKNSLLAASPIIDTISFSYSLQTDLAASGPNNTDFDCEAFVVTSDSIYLFTKEWVSQKSSIYSLPKIPGTYVAGYLSNYNVQGLITGATYLKSERLIVLCGYSDLLQPFLLLLYDFNNHNFFSGNKRKLSLNLPFHQVEGIATNDGLRYYISNEYFMHSLVTTDQKLHVLDLTAFLDDYINTVPVNSIETKRNNIIIYPNPANQLITIEVSDQLIGEQYLIVSMNGKVLLRGEIDSGKMAVSIEDLHIGSYLLVIKDKEMIVRKIIKD